jgi:hypothetical protein
VEEPPIILQSLNRTVTIGIVLRRELERVARAQGGDASWLARRIIRNALDVLHDVPLTPPTDGRAREWLE